MMFSRHEALPRGRKFAVAALVCVALLYAFRDHEHRHAVQALRQQQFESGAPLRVSAYPYYWHLFQWYAVAETRDSFATSDMDSRTGQLDPSELEYFPKPAETAVTLAAKRTYLGRAYLSWAQYPLVTESSNGTDYVVLFRDLRYDYPRLRGRITLSCSVELDHNLHIVHERFGQREQIPPID
jgi:inner membrane protein